MNRSEFDFVVDHNHYLKGGTKEACIKARVILQNAINPGNQLHSPGACVTIDEFMEAVNVLVASAFRKDDEIPEVWHCDNDCKKVSDFLCPGECNVKKDSPKRCPYFMDEGLI